MNQRQSLHNVWQLSTSIPTCCDVTLTSAAISTQRSRPGAAAPLHWLQSLSAGSDRWPTDMMYCKNLWHRKHRAFGLQPWIFLTEVRTCNCHKIKSVQLPPSFGRDARRVACFYSAVRRTAAETTLHYLLTNVAKQTLTTYLWLSEVVPKLQTWQQSNKNVRTALKSKVAIKHWGHRFENPQLQCRLSILSRAIVWTLLLKFPFQIKLNVCSSRAMQEN